MADEIDHDARHERKQSCHMLSCECSIQSGNYAGLYYFSHDNHMKLNTKSTFGNFAIEAEADVDEAQRDILAGLGLLQVLQRSPASAAEKAMAGYDKRPSGFKRDSIPFNPANAEKLTEALEKPIEIAKDMSISCAVAVSEYVPTEADVKMPDERAAYARNAKAGTLDALAEKVGFDGEVGDGTAENAPVEFLRAIRAWSKAQVAAI
jgi:hypothetical protein